MNRFTRTLLLVVFSVFALAFAAIFILLVVIDPNRYKPALESVFAEQTGLQMQIAGDISWAFRPVFGFDIADVRISNDVSTQELASFSQISLKVLPTGLLSGSIRVSEFIANDLHVNWIVDADGVNNWFPEGIKESTTANNSSSPPSDISIEIQQITIRNARIAVQDAQNDINTSLENLDISSSDTNLANRPFPFEASFRVRDFVGDKDLRGSLNTTAAIDFDAGNASLDDLKLSLSPLILSGNVKVSDFHNNLSWRGDLASNTFNLSHFLENFSSKPADLKDLLPGGFNKDSEQLTMRLSFSGDSEGISIPSITLSLDEMQAQADVEFAFATANRPNTLVYNLTSNALDLNTYFSADEAAAEPDTPPTDAPAAETPIPVELLKSMNIIGNHRIASLAIAGLQFNDLTMQLNLTGGVLTIDTQASGFYEGQLNALVNLDVRPAVPLLTVNTDLQSINVLALSDALPLADFARGLLLTESEYTLSGNTVQQMLDSINGFTEFSLNENSVDIALVKQVFAAISALSPSGEIARNWPDTLSFSQFDGFLRFTKGLISGQEFQLRMDNFDVTGNGGIDLAAERFDYTMQFTVLGEPAVQTIPVNPTYQGIVWPVQCRAEFSAAPRQYCGPDFQQVRDVFASIARNEVERRVQEAVTDRVPEELQDRARDLLRNLRRN